MRPLRRAETRNERPTTAITPRRPLMQFLSKRHYSVRDELLMRREERLFS